MREKKIDRLSHSKGPWYLTKRISIGRQQLGRVCVINAVHLDGSCHLKTLHYLVLRSVHTAAITRERNVPSTPTHYRVISPNACRNIVPWYVSICIYTYIPIEEESSRYIDPWRVPKDDHVTSFTTTTSNLTMISDDKFIFPLPLLPLLLCLCSQRLDKDYRLISSFMIRNFRF